MSHLSLRQIKGFFSALIMKAVLNLQRKEITLMCKSADVWNSGWWCVQPCGSVSLLWRENDSEFQHQSYRLLNMLYNYSPPPHTSVFRAMMSSTSRVSCLSHTHLWIPNTLSIIGEHFYEVLPQTLSQGDSPGRFEHTQVYRFSPTQKAALLNQQTWINEFQKLKKKTQINLIC